jgi:TRAP-type C4-dicarboxylate transport system substrate-binding protein
LRKIKILFVSFFLLFITACSSSNTTKQAENNNNNSNSSQATDEKYVLKLSHAFSTTTLMHTLMEWFSEEVEKRSDGRLSIDIYPNAQLVTSEQEGPALIQGQIDMAHSGANVLNSLDPMWNFYSLPFLFDYDKDDPTVYFDQKQKFNNHEKGGQLIAKRMEEKGIKVLSIGSFDIFGSMFTREKAITDLESFNGLKVRTTGGFIMPATIEALGSNSITIVGTEAITALQQGVVDATMTVPMYAYDAQLPVSTYHVAPLFDSAQPVAISMKTYESLPKDLQDILIETGKDYDEYHKGVIVEKLKETLPKLENEKGVKFYYPTKEELAEMKEATQVVWDQFAKEIKGGKELLEVLESIK